MPNSLRLSAARIAEAYRVIDLAFRDSPQVEFPSLSQQLGAATLIKIETLNPIRSFKGRRGRACGHPRAPTDGRGPADRDDPLRIQRGAGAVRRLVR